MLSAKKKLPDAEYLLIVEGQSSKDNYPRNYELSYSRALSLVKYWTRNGIRFDDLPCEVIISGSGQASRFRVRPEVINGEANPANQRFVIHIIPKPGIMN
jgi:flagellar motor protein MotB